MVILHYIFIYYKLHDLNCGGRLYIIYIHMDDLLKNTIILFFL